MIKNIIVLLVMTGFSVSALSFEAGEISTLRRWTAEVVRNHDVWNRPACVSYTKSDDELSTLEVTSFYNEETELFSEPTINILTPFDVSFFEVSVEIDRVSEDFSFLPVLPDPQNMSVVGARALFDDRQDLVDSLRLRNRVVAKYLDSSGEVKSVSFSLSGSQVTINTQFEACGLEINERESLETLPQP
jgi:hypothetical protein